MQMTQENKRMEIIGSFIILIFFIYQLVSNQTDLKQFTMMQGCNAMPLSLSGTGSVQCTKYSLLYLHSDLNMMWVWPKPEGF